LYEQGFLRRPKPNLLTTKDLLEKYVEVAKVTTVSWNTDAARSKHLKRHLGARRIMNLTLGDVDEYRERRAAETTCRKKAPESATVDREVELLTRACHFGVSRGLLPRNPLAGVKLLRKPNTRRTVITDEVIDRILAELKGHSPPRTWWRSRPACASGSSSTSNGRFTLTWGGGVVHLAAQDTKTKRPRHVYLTKRALDALKALRNRTPKDAKYVFTNPATGRPYVDPRKSFSTACSKAGLNGVWVHDLRRSFVTNARRAGVPESVVMRMTGHRTRAVFDRYNIVSDDDVRAAVKVLDKTPSAGSGTNSAQFGKGGDPKQ
jgi:integrase